MGLLGCFRLGGWKIGIAFVWIGSSLFATAPLLHKEDVKKTLDQMFAYHVEYREFSPMIVKRSFKVYIEQFDPMRVYLTQDEVRPYLEPSNGEITAMLERVQKEDFSDYVQLNAMINRAILRAREEREYREKELVMNPITSRKEGMLPPYSSYAKSEAELKERIGVQLGQILEYEKRNGDIRGDLPAQRKKIFNFWEKKFARGENLYLPQSQVGMTDHYLYLHILKSVAKSLDAHTTYFSPEEAYEMRTSLEKQFEGIGVVLREGIDGVVIHNMIKGGPAERSGKIQVGDILVEIDGYNLEGMPYEEVLKRLQGKGGVQIGFRHYVTDEEFQTYQVQLKREKIVMQEDRVSYSFEPCDGGVIAKIVLPSFYEASSGGLSCEQDLKEAFRAIRKQGEIKGAVIDMRENSGGFLTQAVKVSGLFMSSGVVVISKYAYGMTQYLRELDGKSFYHGPLVVLTSRASASAAEIVAQALQDYGLAVIVGDDRTYGKGTIQYQTVTDPRAMQFFKVTIGRYYTVSGRTTQIEGVKADIVTPTVYSVLPIGERYLEYALKSDRIPSAYTDSLADVDPRNKGWFQKNYIPNLQKKLSLWTQMLPALREKSAERIRSNRAYNQFLQALAQEKEMKMILRLQNPEGEDLQMQEGVSIVRDMMRAKGAAALTQ